MYLFWAMATVGVVLGVEAQNQNGASQALPDEITAIRSDPDKSLRMAPVGASRPPHQRLLTISGHVTEVEWPRQTRSAYKLRHGEYLIDGGDGFPLSMWSVSESRLESFEGAHLERVPRFGQIIVRHTRDRPWELCNLDLETGQLRGFWHRGEGTWGKNEKTEILGFGEGRIVLGCRDVENGHLTVVILEPGHRVVERTIEAKFLLPAGNGDCVRGDKALLFRLPGNLKRYPNDNKPGKAYSADTFFLEVSTGQLREFGRVKGYWGLWTGGLNHWEPYVPLAWCTEEQFTDLKHGAASSVELSDGAATRTFVRSYVLEEGEKIATITVRAAIRRIPFQTPYEDISDGEQP